jgi:PEGA domain
MPRPVPPSSKGKRPKPPAFGDASDPLLQFALEKPATVPGDHGSGHKPPATARRSSAGGNHRVAPPVRRPTSLAPAPRSAAIAPMPVKPADLAASSSLAPRERWLLGVAVAFASALVVLAAAAMTTQYPPVLPASPLAIPIEAVPSAVKARPLAAFAPIADEKAQDGGFYGSLLIDSMPANARAFVNGQPVGTTPLVLTAVPVGSRVIRLEAENHTPWTSTVRVTADHRTRVNVTLDRTR